MVETVNEIFVNPVRVHFLKKFSEFRACLKYFLKHRASGKQFEMKHNQQWTSHTRVFLEAFFHAKYFLEMAVKYGKELDTAPNTLPSGWAALLCLYDLR